MSAIINAGNLRNDMHPIEVNRVRLCFSFLLLFCVAIASFAQTPERQQFIRVEAPVIVLAHVRVIDGTGAAPRDDQTIVISEGKIQSLGPSKDAKTPANTQTLDLTGYTVLPGLVGMHNHKIGRAHV